MKKIEIALITFFGILSVIFEFRNIRTDSLFFSWFDYFPIVIVFILLIFIIIRNIYRKNKKLLDNISLIIGVICIILVSIHAERIKSMENSELLFEARTREIGSDGGLILDFHKNGLLKAEKEDHWCVTYYWGNYTRKIDTIVIDLPKDFELSDSAIIEKDSMLVFKDSIKFDLFNWKTIN